MKHIKYFTGIIIFIWTTHVFSGTACVPVSITNSTKENCALTSSENTYSYSTPTTPKRIITNDSKEFLLCRSTPFRDSVIHLNYQCGANNATFDVTNPYAVFSSPPPSLTIINQQGLALTSNAEVSSIDITINPA